MKKHLTHGYYDFSTECGAYLQSTTDIAEVTCLNCLKKRVSLSRDRAAVVARLTELGYVYEQVETRYSTTRRWVKGEAS